MCVPCHTPTCLDPTHAIQPAMAASVCEPGTNPCNAPGTMACAPAEPAVCTCNDHYKGATCGECADGTYPNTTAGGVVCGEPQPVRPYDRRGLNSRRSWYHTSAVCAWPSSNWVAPYCRALSHSLTHLLYPCFLHVVRLQSCALPAVTYGEPQIACTGHLSSTVCMSRLSHLPWPPASKPQRNCKTNPPPTMSPPCPQHWTKQAGLQGAPQQCCARRQLH